MYIHRYVNTHTQIPALTAANLKVVVFPGLCSLGGGAVIVDTLQQRAPVGLWRSSKAAGSYPNPSSDERSVELFQDAGSCSDNTGALTHIVTLTGYIRTVALSIQRVNRSSLGCVTGFPD
jgi:hypothetical protein